MAVDNTNPLAYGFEKTGRRDVRQQPGDAARSECGDARHPAGGVVRRQGQRCAPDGRGASSTSQDGVAAAEAKVGKGKVFLFGPEITFRAQPHGTFKFLFNSIFYGTSVHAGTTGNSTTTAQQ